MEKKRIAPVEGPGVRLRLLQESDLSTTRAWRNQDHIRVWFHYSQPLSEEVHRSWYDKYAIRADDYTFIIEMLDRDLPAGQVAVYGIDWEKREGEYGRCIIGEPQAAGKNLLYLASMLLIDVARRELGLKRLYLNVKKDNAKAIHIYKKLGFVPFKEEQEALFMELFLDSKARALE